MAKKTSAKASRPRTAAQPAPMIAAQPTPATVTVSFQEGQGTATAILFRNGANIGQATLNNGGSHTFPNVIAGDTIHVDGTLTGTSATVGIDRSTSPATPATFTNSPFADGFDILT
ncbi:MAG TPA: hypothetical protein VMH27_04985 [Puia sp.]|nr:hypothetical protein [Puia sp.]